MTTELKNKSGSTVKVSTGKVSNTHTRKAFRRRGDKVREAKPVNHKVTDRSESLAKDLEAELKRQVTTWERKKTKTGKVSADPDYIVKQLKDSTAALLLENGVDPAATRSRADEIEPLIRTVRRGKSAADRRKEEKVFKEPEGLKEIRPMSEDQNLSCGSKGARGRGYDDRQDYGELEFCMADSTKPVGLGKDKVKAVEREQASAKKHDLKFRKTILKGKLGYFNPNRYNTCAFNFLAEYLFKNPLGVWNLNPDYYQASRNKWRKPEYRDAVDRLAEQFRANID